MGTMMRKAILDLAGKEVFSCDADTHMDVVGAAVAAGIDLADLETGRADMMTAEWEYAYRLEREKAIEARAELEACKAPVARLETEAIERLVKEPVGTSLDLSGVNFATEDAVESSQARPSVARRETEARRTPPDPVAAPEVSFTFREATVDEQAALRHLVAVLYATARTMHARVLSIQGQMCAVNYASVVDGYGTQTSTSYRVHKVGEKTLETLRELEFLDADLRKQAESGEPCES